MKYRHVTAVALALIASFSTPGVSFAAKKTDTTIVAPTKPAKQPPPLPNWIETRMEQGQKCPQWESLFKEFGLPVKYFSYISWRESRCRKSAVNARWKNGKIVWTLNKNGTFDSGLLQVNSGWRTVTSQVCKSRQGDLSVLLSPRCNVAVARYLYDNGGLRHWSM